MGGVQCCDSDVGPPDLRAERRPEKRGNIVSKNNPIGLQMEMEEEKVAPKPVLGYWNIRGLAQPIRFMLAFLAIDYEDRTYE